MGQAKRRANRRVLIPSGHTVLGISGVRRTRKTYTTHVGATINSTLNPVFFSHVVVWGFFLFAVSFTSWGFLFCRLLLDLSLSLHLHLHRSFRDHESEWGEGEGGSFAYVYTRFQRIYLAAWHMRFCGRRVGGSARFIIAPFWKPDVFRL